MKLIRKIKEVGLKNVLVGGWKRIKYGKLIKKYHFDSWHLSPYEWKEYAQACVNYINADNGRTVVDIGCGLGGILQHVKAEKRIGLDLHEEVILAARELNDKTITWRTGSFDALVEKPVDYLVTLNFMHGGTEETWREPYHTAAKRNDVRRFIVDTVPEGGGSHFLHWDKILPDNYRRAERLGPFLSGRYVEIWEKTER
ncbi:MAG: class I SAM-dependent methyltransferase [Lachnospiraceae bacterium]|nr:class I SAM-dependent methyltransferase [Lachnospiraceae bacterium]